MVCSTLSYEKAAVAVLMTGVMMSTGCSTKSDNAGFNRDAYVAALEATASVEAMVPDSETERRALDLFRDFYTEYSAEAIRDGVRNLYAEDAWFGDPFHTVKGIDAVEHYFLKMAEPVEHCTFTVDAIQRNGIDYYARWTMYLVSKAAKEPIEAIGISHVRFNAEGKIVFQQDYWDTSTMFDRLPVVGFWTRLVKGRIAKGLEE
jgi:limonene-1,2-epoxide hydrolase